MINILSKRREHEWLSGMIEIAVNWELWNRVQKSVYKRTTKTAKTEHVQDQSDSRSYESGMLSSDGLTKMKSYELALGFNEIPSWFFVGHWKEYLFVFLFFFWYFNKSIKQGTRSFGSKGDLFLESIEFCLSSNITRNTMNCATFHMSYKLT